LPDPPSHNPVGKPFIELQTIDSTNNYALTQVHAGLAQDGTAIFAHEQSSGKGRWGKKWSSPARENIALSVIHKPVSLAISDQFQLSVCIAVAVHSFFMKYAGDETRIKWPNDLYWRDRKAGGILIDNVIRQDSWEWAVIGIGININQAAFPPDIPNPVSLKQITGKNFDPVPLAKELCAIINEMLHSLPANGSDDILDYYLAWFYKKNEKVKLKKDNRVFEATIKGITQSGELLVQHVVEEHFRVGEIEWLIK
jgi:BirA family biotin operon repressor/biotin-[acetyl-CoA-carboxylase] ligase